MSKLLILYGKQINDVIADQFFFFFFYNLFNFFIYLCLDFVKWASIILAISTCQNVKVISAILAGNFNLHLLKYYVNIIIFLYIFFKPLEI